ncbi:MAG: response regulator [Mariprofundaceae bacterium]|nr:response regulator [Mariprofundaceae bacterium]
MKILIVEDNPANMKLASNLLKKNGYEVLKAVDAETGIDIARKQLPDLILMDIQLPGMDGLAATGILKEDPATMNIPVIALTAFAMKGDEEKMLGAGCDGYIPKPIRYKEFLDTISTLLNRPDTPAGVQV